ncbi:hypothetical protein [Halomonas caseinilytica]|uniref:hypothetical protein n=1 Tax=Halomonas caseinilytica TaxID=438744 RepID=UPI0008496BE9|nr:hypothetical protein [Halomonas caseinilytica]
MAKIFRQTLGLTIRIADDVIQHPFFQPDQAKRCAVDRHSVQAWHASTIESLVADGVEQALAIEIDWIEAQPMRRGGPGGAGMGDVMARASSAIAGQALFYGVHARMFRVHPTTGVHRLIGGVEP